MLAKLLAGSRVTQVPARVYVRASSEWSAKSTADANIYVSLGILLRLDNEDEVAALLVHEALHVILGHAKSDVVQGVEQRAMQLSALAVDAHRAPSRTPPATVRWPGDSRVAARVWRTSRVRCC